MDKQIRAGLCALGAVWFVEGVVLGSVLFLSCFIHPEVGSCALLSGGGAWGVSRGMYARRVSRLPELLNAGLWGLFVGTVLPFDLRTLFLALSGGAFLSVLCLGFSYLLMKIRGGGLILTLPFAVAVGLSAWVFPEAMPELSPSSSGWAIAFFESISVVTFTASPFWGIVFFLLLAGRSLWLAGLAMAGFFIGGLGESLLGGQGIQAPAHFAGLNYILVAMALGGGLIPPDRFTGWRVFGGMGGAVLFQVIAVQLWGTWSWMTVTLGFNLIAMFTYYMGTSRWRVPEWIDCQLAPELRWQTLQYRRKRYPLDPPALHLPVLGQWKVSQGAGSQWSHQHAWQHAIDLVLCDDEGKRFYGRGKSPEDYYAWNKTVVSPLDGWVENIEAGLPDQAIGQVETEHNWGNYVMIREARGFRVLLAHLKHQSIQVVPGQPVYRGQWIARCGNSGYSPEPHLHFHVQQGPLLGEATIPFRIMSLAIQKQLPVATMPMQSDLVEGLMVDDFISAATSYMLDQELFFENVSGEKFSYRIQLAVDGSFEMRATKGSLYFGRFEERFMLYSVRGDDAFLNALFHAFPSIPLYARVGDEWTDLLPGRSLKEVKLTRETGLEIQSYSESYGAAKVRLSDTQGIQYLETVTGQWTRVGCEKKDDVKVPQPTRNLQTTSL
ncbi:urea transporter [Kiritimatiellota bacterium B12222]|nr:urea transporter [Kiritimatiellota bacterium B12222]